MTVCEVACESISRVASARRSYSNDEFFKCTMIFHAGCAFYPAANVDRMGRHRRDRLINVPSIQTTGENQEPGVAHRSSRSGPIARLTRPASELGVVGIDEYIAFRERCCLFWLKSCIG